MLTDFRLDRRNTNLELVFWIQIILARIRIRFYSDTDPDPSRL